MLGITLDFPRIFNWCSTWRKILHHNCIGNFASIPHKTATKWSLNVWTAFSAIFRLWSWWDTSWYFILLVFTCFFNSFEHSLSKIWILGSIPHVSTDLPAFYMLWSSRPKFDFALPLPEMSCHQFDQYHNVLIPTIRSYGKTASLVSIHFALQIVVKVVCFGENAMLLLLDAGLLSLAI